MTWTQDLKAHLYQFADDTKLGGTVDSLEGREALQRDVGKLMKFNQGKCWILHLAWGDCGYMDWLGSEMLENSPGEMDLGVLVSD